MAGMYVCNFAATAVTVQVDFFELITPATTGLELHALFIGQSTEIGDAQEEQLLWAVKRGATTTGTGGTQAAVPVALQGTAGAAVVTYDTLNTTKATTGTIVTLHNGAFNVRAGLEMIWTPETRPMVGPSSRITIELQSTPTDSITFVGTAYIRETD